MNAIDEDVAIKRIANYCARSEHCRADACEKLRQWGVEAKAIERILTKLEADGYIDDERFCRSFVNDKFRLAKWGRLKIAQALSFKRIPSEITQRHLNEIDEEEYAGILENLLKTKIRSIKGKDQKDVEIKLIRFALSRGFEMQYIKQCLIRLFN